MTAGPLRSETNCCSTGSPHLEVLPGGGGGGVSQQPCLRSLGSVGFRQHAGRRPFPRLGGAMSQPHRCVYTLNQLSSGRTRDVQAAESGHWRCRQQNAVDFLWVLFFLKENTFQCGHSAPFFSFSSSATRTKLRDGNSRN